MYSWTYTEGNLLVYENDIFVGAVQQIDFDKKVTTYRMIFDLLRCPNGRCPYLFNITSVSRKLIDCRIIEEFDTYKADNYII